MTKLDKAVKGVLITVLILTAGLFLYALIHVGEQEEPYAGMFEVNELSDGWTLIGPDGTLTPDVRLPVDARQTAEQAVLLRGRLPSDISGGMRLCVRAVRQDVVIRVNGEERANYRAIAPEYGRRSPLDAFVLADLYGADAGGTVEIKLVPKASGLGRYYEVTYAYGNNVWFPYIMQSLPLVLIAVFLILFGMLSVAAYYFMRKKMPSFSAVRYLAETMIVSGMWILSESKIRQLIFRSPSYSSIFSYLLMEVMAALFIMYFNEVQEQRYKLVYTVLECGILFQIIVNTALALTGVANYYQTLTFSHIWAGLGILLTILALAADVRSKRIRKYALTAVGMLTLLLCAAMEIIDAYIPNSAGFGVYLGLGLIVLLGTTLIQSVNGELLRVKRQQASDNANRAKSAFLANMSHEIRTPINAILGMDEMILRESSEREIRSYARDIQNAGKTLLSIINDILDFSKVEEGKMEILPTQYDISSVINDLVNMVRGRAEDKGLQFTLQVDENTPTMLFGDEIRIRQCALNLLTNAVKYTEKGSVTLGVGFETRGEDRISLRFTVIDTGIGLKPGDIDRIFSPFSRVEESRNRSIEGTGLGMSITRQLLELMDSHLDVQSVYGEGSTFSFAVEQPVVKWTPIGEFAERFEADRTRHETYRESFRAPGARILVVDDMPVNLTVIKGLLKRTRIVVDTAESGEEAVRKAAQQQYDVIFIDHMMPGMDGIETLAALKELPSMEEHTSFIALTANAVSGAREMYFEAGFSDYLAKPVDSKALEEMLMTHLPPAKLSMAEKTEESGEEAAPAVFVVSCDERLCDLAADILKQRYRVKVCRSAEGAPAQAEEFQPDLILLDVRMGEKSGLEVLRALKRSALAHDVPTVLMIDEEDAGVEAVSLRNGAADFIRKAHIPDTLMRRIRRIIQLSRLQADLQNEVKRQIERSERLSKEMMITLSTAIDAKDRFARGHSTHVATYAAEIARRMGRSGKEQERIYAMGLLHDIGKIGVGEDVLNKTEKLSEEEKTQIRRHTVIGGEILRAITEMPELAQIARWHHERYDGTGYPDGLKGEDIPEAARIICVADSYDAMTSTRVYSRPRTQSEVRAEIVRCSGTQFDPKIAKIMLRMIDEDTGFRMTERTVDAGIWKGSSQYWLFDAQEKTEDAVPERDGLPSWLAGVEEIDRPTGLRFCGTPEVYLDTLTIYAKNVESFAGEIERAYGSGDVATATVKIHALKSTSLVIGAAELSALAKDLEAAGHANDTQKLDAELGGLIARYRALGRRLAPLTEPEAERDGELPAISDEQLQTAYGMIRSLLADFEYDRAASMIGSLYGFRLPEDERERCDKLRSAAENFDWDRIEELLP